MRETDRSRFSRAVFVLLVKCGPAFGPIAARGVGWRVPESAPPAPAGALAGFAEDLVWLCRQLAVEKPVVVGHSMGGNVALELAASYPDFAAAIVNAFSFRDPKKAVNDRYPPE